jgi:hypothetical protein
MKIIIFAIAVATASSSAMADTSYDYPDTAEYYAFIQEMSPVYSWSHPNAGERRYDVTNIQDPIVQFYSQEELDAIIGSDGMGEVVALYEEGVMYLNETIDFSVPEDESVFFHELVHHVQWVSGEHEDPHFQACPIHLENDAYRIQLAWMVSQDVSDEWVYMMQINNTMSSGVICYADRP